MLKSLCTRAQRVNALSALFWLAGVCGCGSKERPRSLADPEPLPIPYDRLPKTTDAFQERECETELDGHASQCGTVTVPEVLGAQRNIELSVRRVFSSAAEVALDPFVYLNGGPGASTVADAATYAEVFANLLEKRDLVLIDQRGTGDSVPDLTCTEDGPADTALANCFERLSKNADLASYRTESNAGDFERVRLALGYPPWNLLGISYGTRLGLTIARDFPAGVRSLVLDSVVPLEVDLIADVGLNGQNALKKTFVACQLDAECARRYPDPLTQLKKAVTELNEEPVTDAKISGDDFVEILYNLQYSPQGVGIIPYLVNQAAEKRFETFGRVAEVLSNDGFSIGMHLSVQCAEEVPFTTAELVAANDLQIAEELRAPLSGAEYFSYCAQWRVPAAPAAENEPVVSGIPSLVLSGNFDPITPPSYASAVAAKLTKSQYFDFPNESHGVSAGACAIAVVSAFLDEPEAALDASCRNEAPGFSFKAAIGARPQTQEHTNETRSFGKPRFVLDELDEQSLDKILRDVALRKSLAARSRVQKL